MIETKKPNTYAVVDLEATGTGIDAKIIQIGIVIVENGCIREQFETDINPYEKLDSHIVQLTGITDQQLSKAPDFGQVAGRIFELIGDAVFVAHNVTFDANLLAEALFFEGYELRTPRVDTVELSQLFFPTFEKYSLSNLSHQLDLNLQQAHTAISDAVATANLLLAIQRKIAGLPKQTVKQILDLSDHLLYESRLVIDEVYNQMSEFSSVEVELVHGLALKKKQLAEPENPLSKDFLKNLAQLGLKERPQQTEFARLIEKRLVDEGQVHFIQAQAGIGKTFGYLLPLLAMGQEKLLITVPTKILQEQIMNKEGQALKQAFSTSISSVKSSTEYIKLDTFWKILQEENENRLVNQFKMRVLVWLCETNTGDLSELKQRYRYPSFFEHLAHNGRLGSDSLFYEWDFWRRLQAEAMQSRVLLTNHAYFLNHLQERDALMTNRMIVIDEAQKFLLAAEELSSKSQSVDQVLHLLKSKKEKSTKLLDKRLYEACYFELNHLLKRFRQTGEREIEKSSLQQLIQCLGELQDFDVFELEKLLTCYNHFWIEETIFEGKKHAYLRASKKELLDVSKLLPSHKTFCISASLEISKNVSLADLLGFKDVTFDRLGREIPTNQCLFILEDLPDVLSLDKRSHANMLVNYIQDIQGLNRPILLLFTSIALLMEVSDLLEEKGISHLAQHRHGQDYILKKRFDKGECKLLLGTGVFWEGVDFANQPEIIQCITRLPFDNPKDRLVHKINHLLRLKGKHPFYDYSLPMMMAKLQQAIGRTNRSSKQDSVVIILDNRLLGRRYGKQLLEFLEDNYQLQYTNQTELTACVNYFFDKSKENKQEP